MKRLKWGILSTSKFSINHMIPAILASETSSLHAIASRNPEKAQRIAADLNIPVSYGSYEELLADESIDVIYNPLPNHLHVPWTIKSLEAGKHVLCEKPIALDSNEAEKLLLKSREFPDLRVMEAFMYRFHPQWKKAKELIENREIGTLQSVHSVFTYYNDDAENVRNKPNMGGGGLMDIGCYCISLSRYLFGKEPDTVSGKLNMDAEFDVDSKASGILTFGDRTATFTCSTRMRGYQRVTIFGSDGLIEIETPFNPAGNKIVGIILTKNGERQRLEFEPVNQYRVQVDAFCGSILHGTAVPTSLEDAVANMKVIDAIFKSDKERTVVQM